MIFTLISAEPHFTFCPDTAHNYELNSTFEKNLRSLFDSLPLKTSLNEGFYNTSVGNGTNSVYVQALCRGDVTSKVCHNCVQNASQEIMKQCQREEAIIWYELCQIQYSYSNFFGSNVYTGKYPDSDYEMKNVSDPAHFHVIWKDFMENLIVKVAFGHSELMFATGKTKISESETIYGLVQCTRDVSHEICKSCLDSAFGDLDGLCGFRQGGTVFSRSCNMRFELYQFYSRSTANNGKNTETAAAYLLTS